MAHIQVLDQMTIDKIAAGEVIERPASIVKELVENAIDAGATSVTVEIEDGGITLIRITDNGCGILREDIRNAFLRHSTSKIRCVEDLSQISSLGFRGGSVQYCGRDQGGTGDKAEGRNIWNKICDRRRQRDFYGRYRGCGWNDFLCAAAVLQCTGPQKVLKTPMTEAGHVQDLLMRLALSHPEVGFRFLNNRQEKLRTSGSGKLDEVIYHIYGRDVASNLLDLDYETAGIRIRGYIGKPVITRRNRNFETFFVNGRYVKSAMISKALEDACKDFMMQHKFPFAVLAFDIDSEQVDVNVHPTKMELRFQKQQEVYNTVFEGIHRRLSEPELIPQVEVPEPKRMPEDEKKAVSGKAVSESVLPAVSTETETENTAREERPAANVRPAESPFLLRPKKNVSEAAMEKEVQDEEYFIRKMRERVMEYHDQIRSAAEAEKTKKSDSDDKKEFRISQERMSVSGQKKMPDVIHENKEYFPLKPSDKNLEHTEAKQLDLFEEKLLKREIRAEYKLIGQVFDTYWLVQFQDNLYIIDQHAAHERVLYERTLKEMKNREYTSQYLSPPIILTLSMQEAQLLNEHMDRFQRIGFEIEPFGGKEYAVRAVPANLFSIAKKELLIEMLDSLSDSVNTSMTPDLIDEKVASLSCKAAVKGNNRLSAQEVDTLIGELLLLSNPYHCPHGRPTIIAMSKRELEKKFKRIV